MTPIQRLFEAHLTVANLETAITFYRDTLGLTLAHVVPERRVAFFWLGPRGHTMLGIWETGSAPQRMSLHIAFAVELAHLLNAPRALTKAGVQPLNFDGQPAIEPEVFGWMPAASIFFRDPDGNLLEYLTMLPDAPRPEAGIVKWSQWREMVGGAEFEPATSCL